MAVCIFYLLFNDDLKQIVAPMNARAQINYFRKLQYRKESYSSL